MPQSLGFPREVGTRQREEEEVSRGWLKNPRIPGDVLPSYQMANLISDPCWEKNTPVMLFQELCVILLCVY